MQSCDQLLALFGDRAGKVYFRHDPELPAVAMVMVVFEIGKAQGCDHVVKSEHTSHLRHNVRDIGKVLGGFVDYYRKGSVTTESRSALLKLHCDTNGRFTNRLARLVRALRPPRPPSPVSGFLGDLTVERQKAIAASIARDGYYVFEQRVPGDLCDQIEAFAARTPCRVEGGGP